MIIWITLIIVIITYISIALGEFPRLRVNRTTVTLMGVRILLATRQIAFNQMSDFLDLNKLLLLFGMMILNTNLQLSGSFRLPGRTIPPITHTPWLLLAILIVVTGVLSALFLNDTICLKLTFLLLEITISTTRNPIPYLIALATAANISSVATLTDNFQNMITGFASGISYVDFAHALTPISLLSRGGICFVIGWFYPDEFRSSHFDLGKLPYSFIYHPLFNKSMFVTGGLLISFFSGVPIAEAAFVAAWGMLLTRRIKLNKLMGDVNWNLLVFIGALFIISGAIETNDLTTRLYNSISYILKENSVILCITIVILCNLISNGSAVLPLKPIIPNLSDPQADGSPWRQLPPSSGI